LLSSARTTASVGMLIAGALVFNYVVTVENIPHSLQLVLTQWELGPVSFFILVNVILLPSAACSRNGNPLDHRSRLHPHGRSTGIDAVHFGVVTVVNIMIG
jgi:TRAP-type C4-dicarboxylate transport system permease large subunit